MGEWGDDTAKKVEHQVSEMPDMIFDIVAENEKKQHISDDVQVIGVDEKPGEERDYFLQGLEGHPPSLEETGGNEAAADNKIWGISGEIEKIDKYRNIYHDKGYIYPGRALDFYAVSIRNHPAMF